jgi:outer membrane protein OmpA-like peptidoglycan-associated protein
MSFDRPGRMCMVGYGQAARGLAWGSAIAACRVTGPERMPRLRTTLAALALVAGPLAAAPAGAQTVSGLYIGGGAGANFWINQSSGAVGLQDQDAGWVVLGAVGWGFGNGWRLELEGSWRGSNMDRTTVNGATAGQGGRLNNFAGMANMLFDFDLTNFGVAPTTFMPYVGGGIGIGQMQLSGLRFATPTSSFRIEDSDIQFAYQGIAGAAFGLGGMVPGLALTAEYRFYGTLEQSLNVQRLSGPPVAGVPDTLKLDNMNHSVLLGLRYSFGAAPAPAAPAAAPAPAPAPARTFLVFFDWDRADLTTRAREIIAEAAQTSTRVQTTRIEVAGHADRSGTPQYNQRLSQRRADAVAAELVRQGVARSAIVVTAFGESRPLVPTADGVREPQNRRVEIVLR